MDFNIQTLPFVSTNDPAYKKATELLPSYASLEEVIYRIVHAGFRIDCAVVPEDGGVLTLAVSDAGFNLKKPKQLYCIPFPMPVLRKMYKFKAISTAIYPLADKANTVTLDEDFITRRDDSLKVRMGDEYDNRYGPPSAMCPLILSYVDTCMGFVTITREFVDLKRYPEDAAKLHLVHIPNGSDSEVAQEWIYIPFNQLRNVIEGRKKRREEGALA